MRVDVFDANTPARVTMFEAGQQKLAVIADGSGSWDGGEQAAALCRQHLSRVWATASAWTATQVVADITEAVERMPDSPAADKFGWSFSITALLCTANLVESLAIGVYRVEVLSGHKRRVLFRPHTLVDQLLANGSLSPEAAETFTPQNMCIGPFATIGQPLSLSVAARTLEAGEAITVTNQMFHGPPSLDDIPRSAAELAALTGAASPVVLVLG